MNESFDRDQRVIANALKIRYTPFVADRGDGVTLYDDQGKSYLDFGAGWGVASLGYSNQRVRQAVFDQLDRSMYAGLISAINEPALELAEKLVDLMPREQPHKVWFGLSGSDASETAQRLVRQATGKPGIISFIGSWHGTTDATMGISGHAAFAGSTAGGNVTKVPYPDPFRNPFGRQDGSVADQCLDYLERYLFATVCPPEQVAAVFVETVQSDGGDIVPPPDFLPKLRGLCDRHDILLIVDDIKIGLGRTGRMFSFEHHDIQPDILLLGKSLGAGLPLSAVIGPPEILDVGTGVALSTTVGNATSCAAALAGIEVIEQEGLAENAATVGDYLQLCLRQALGDVNEVADVRGRGLIQGVDLVSDPAELTPNQPLAAKIVYRAWELGLITYYAGNWSNVVEMTPPLILTKADVDRGVTILSQAFRDVADGKVSDEAVRQFAGW